MTRSRASSASSRSTLAPLARRRTSRPTRLPRSASRRNSCQDKEKPSMAKRRDATRIQARVSELLAEYKIPSAAIGVLHDGEITDFAVGVKNVTTEEPATTDTIYQCGSMTKTWTALAFMQLV